MQVLPEQTGFLPETGHHDPASGRYQRRPLSMAWISDELTEQTQQVWSPLYEREISEEEAVEMLMNVKRFAEVLLRIKQRRMEK